ncbi:hypothetical protein Tlie_1169 [Thermovirga lienii DSM 17291]|uniref:Uncharacterized protein n=1 Tax=Thermovirga lienii (strain ATCC BAA-1197 / DSM 17291 / Cas60314) TaxID=580340 RepID=G7V5B7_THELD|nr:hypothetical protein Tlie_1169 [Thermovirga lienii DSM 17291]
MWQNRIRRARRIRRRYSFTAAVEYAAMMGKSKSDARQQRGDV